jgi:hypothetical protein
MIADSKEELQHNTFAQVLDFVTDVDIGPDDYMYVLSNYMEKDSIVIPPATGRSQ